MQCIMALAYEISFDYDNALQWYEKALTVGSDEKVKALSNYGIAIIYARKGDTDKASEYLKAAVALDSDLAEMAEKDSLFQVYKISIILNTLILLLVEKSN